MNLIAFDADKLKMNLNAKLLEIKKLAATRNVVITRWARDRRNAISSKLSNWLDLNGQGHEAKSGVLVFGDIRTMTLHTGDDFIDMLKGMDKRYREFLNESGVTVFIIQAKHGAYSADLDMERAVSIRLSLTKEQLGNLSKTFQHINLAFSDGFGLTLDLSNSAFLSQSSASAETRCFFPPSANDASIKREILASEGYQSLYAVRAQLKDDLFDRALKAKTSLSSMAKECSDLEMLKESSFNSCLKDKAPSLNSWLGRCDSSMDRMEIHEKWFDSRGLE